MLRTKENFVIYLLPVLLLFSTASHAMHHAHHASAILAIIALASPSLPSHMDIVAEMQIPQKNGLRSVTKFLYLKKQSDQLVPTPGGLIAGHQDTESHDLEISLEKLDRSAGNAIFKCMVTETNKHSDSLFHSIKVPLNASSSKTYQLPIGDEHNKPITLTIKSTIQE